MSNFERLSVMDRVRLLNGTATPRSQWGNGTGYGGELLPAAETTLEPEEAIQIAEGDEYVYDQMVSAYLDALGVPPVDEVPEQPQHVEVLVPGIDLRGVARPVGAAALSAPSH